MKIKIVLLTIAGLNLLNAGGEQPDLQRSGSDIAEKRLQLPKLKRVSTDVESAKKEAEAKSEQAGLAAPPPSPAQVKRAGAEIAGEEPAAPAGAAPAALRRESSSAEPIPVMRADSMTESKDFEPIPPKNVE